MNKSDKRSDILQVALELIAERGFHDAPMSMIAKNAGVAAGTIYRYFESKDVLITELHRELEETIKLHLQKDYPAERPLRERFLYINRKLLRYFIDHPLHFRYMEQFFDSPYGISQRKERVFDSSGNNDILTDIFKQGIEQKIIKDLPKVALFSLAFGPLSTLISDHNLGFMTLNDLMIERITEACWDAIKK